MSEHHTATHADSTAGRQIRSKKRARAISSLTEEQLQNKRNVDRKAQRAFRQRNKDSIERLEQQIASIVKTATESEAKLQIELATVRESRRTLQQCLEQISDLASTAVRSIALTGTGAERQSNPSHIETDHQNEITAGSDHPPDSTLSTSQFIASIASGNDGADVNGVDNAAAACSETEGSPTLLPNGTTPHHQRQPSLHPIDFSDQQQSMSPPMHDSIVEPVSSLYDRGETNLRISSTSFPTVGASFLSPSASQPFATIDPDLEEGEQSLCPVVQSTNDEMRDGIDISPHAPGTVPSVSTLHGVRSNPIFTVFPSHLLPTCPLDEILHNFLISRRDLITHGIDLRTAAGPSKPTVKAILDPTTTSSVHPLCGIMSEVLTTFAHVNQPEKLAFYFLMYRTMRVGTCHIL